MTAEGTRDRGVANPSVAWLELFLDLVVVAAIAVIADGLCVRSGVPRAPRPHGAKRASHRPRADLVARAAVRRGARAVARRPVGRHAAHVRALGARPRLRPRARRRWPGSRGRRAGPPPPLGRG